MGRFIEDRFEAQLEIDKPREAVWRALEETNQDGQPCWLTAFPCAPGFETTGEVVSVERPRLVRVHKHSEPCKDTEIAISLESTETGTRVLVVQSGFPASVKDALDLFTLGGDQITADLALYLERGVQMSRHSMPWAFAGILGRDAQSGLEVVGTVPGCYGERIGLERGDLLLTLGDAPVFGQACLQTLLRVFRMGDEIAASWVRGTDLQQGSAVL